MYYCKLALMVMFEPQQAFTLIKRRRERISVFLPLLLLALCAAVRIAAVYVVHFPLSTVTPDNASLGGELLGLLGPLVSWILGLYLVTTIRNGETTFKEILTATTYSMVPYILLTLPVAGLSRLLSIQEAGIYSTLQTLVMLWCIVLMLYSVMHMNSYTFAQTLFVAVVGILAVVFVWAVLFLLYILGDKLFAFIGDVILEYQTLGDGV